MATTKIVPNKRKPTRVPLKDVEPGTFFQFCNSRPEDVYFMSDVGERSSEQIVFAEVVSGRRAWEHPDTDAILLDTTVMVVQEAS